MVELGNGSMHNGMFESEQLKSTVESLLVNGIERQHFLLVKTWDNNYPLLAL